MVRYSVLISYISYLLLTAYSLEIWIVGIKRRNGQFTIATRRVEFAHLISGTHNSINASLLATIPFSMCVRLRAETRV